MGAGWRGGEASTWWADWAWITLQAHGAAGRRPRAIAATARCAPFGSDGAARPN